MSFLDLLSIMLFPRHGMEKQREWVACALTAPYETKYFSPEHSSERQKLVAEFMAECFVWHLNRPAHRIFYDDRFSRARKGKHASMLFRAFLSCAIHHPHHFFIDGRHELFRGFLREKEGVSEQRTNRAWSEFQCVAHFWHAWFQLTASETLEIKTPFFERLPDLLGIAEAFRKSGITEGVLRPDEVWAVQGDICALDLAVLPLREDELKILDWLNPTSQRSRLTR